MITDMGSIISQMLVLVSIMILGYILGKIRFIGKDESATISKLVINVAVSANIFAALLDDDLAINGKSAITFFIIVIGYNVLLFILSLIVPRLICAPKKDIGVYQFMTMFKNTGFMGYPVARAIFGEVSVIYVTYFIIAFNLLAYSLGVAMIRRSKEKFDFKVFLSPMMITTAASLVLLIVGFKPPEFLLGTAKSLSQIMTPLAMLVIGVSLSEMRFKDLFGEWRVIPIILVELIITPLIAWLILKNFISDPLMLGITTVIAGMPTASAGTMLCITYGANEKLIAKTTFMTNILTAVTIPLIVYFLL